MTFSFEVFPTADAESGMDATAVFDGYEQPYEEEDFEALGVNPLQPTPAKPGSEEKVSMLAARYAAGLPLWHDDDCCDHGPGEVDLMGLRQER